MLAQPDREHAADFELMVDIAATEFVDCADQMLDGPLKPADNESLRYMATALVEACPDGCDARLALLRAAKAREAEFTPDPHPLLAQDPARRAANLDWLADLFFGMNADNHTRN